VSWRSSMASILEAKVDWRLWQCTELDGRAYIFGCRFWRRTSSYRSEEYNDAYMEWELRNCLSYRQKNLMTFLGIINHVVNRLRRYSCNLHAPNSSYVSQIIWSKLSSHILCWGEAWSMPRGYADLQRDPDKYLWKLEDSSFRSD
jgi:hypothetical protein